MGSIIVIAVCNIAHQNRVGMESLLKQVWEAYGAFTADELETISHGEIPWKNARKGYQNGDACSNEISDYDILRYYSNLE